MPTRRSVARILVAAIAVAGPRIFAVADGDARSQSGWTQRLLERLSAPSTDPLRINPVTGADARNYPTDPQADFVHMRLDLDIPSMEAPRMNAVETLRFEPLGAPLRTLTLDAKRLTITDVSLASSGRIPQWSNDGMTLQVRFDPPLAPGVGYDLRIAYTVEDPVEGLYWSPARDEKPGRPARAAQLYSQGEAEMNSNWFITHDFPNDKLTTELVVTVPDGFLVVSNGSLVLKQSRGGRTTFHWKQDKPHSSYLVTLVVGKFDVVDVGDDRLPLPVYAPPGEGPNVQQTFGPTMDMIHLYEERLDEPYPWDKYANVVVWNFGYGGMENTSATTVYDTAVLDAKSLLDGDQDGLNSHELAHQWFGDLLTCNSWEHIWLNEGFATYMEMLWLESRDGFDEGYLLDAYRNNRRAAQTDRLDPDDPQAWMRPAMVSKLYNDPDDVFGKAANPYSKGASVLHMLRMRLGDDVFFKALRTYVNRFKFRTVETSDLRRVFEEISGQSLEQFFDQWAYRPGTPQVTVTSDWNYETNELRLGVEQTQRIDAMTPAFAFTLPVLIESESGAQTWIDIDVTGRRHERTVTLKEAPAMVVVDPYLHVLMTPTVEEPTPWILAQLRRGPTVASRLDAAEFLKTRAGSATDAALVAALTDRDEQRAVRSAAAQTLGELNATDALLDTLGAGVEDARIKRAVVVALGKIEDDRVADALAPIASNADESYAVRSAALSALGERGDASRLPILLDALDAESQHEQVRQAALRGLASLDEAGGLDAAIRYTQLGWLARTRPVAIGAVADLAHYDNDRAIDALLPLLTDREDRARDAAARALSKIGDAHVLERMRHVAATHRNPKYAERLEKLADTLAAKLNKDSGETDLRQRVEELQREVDTLKTSKNDH